MKLDFSQKQIADGKLKLLWISEAIGYVATVDY